MSGFCKYYKQKKQVSYDNGVTWTDVSPLETRKGDLYEENSSDCGYVPLKFQAKYSDSSEYSLPCDGNTILSSNQTKPSGYQYSAMTEAVIGDDCVTTIGDFAFSSYMGLTSVTIPDSVTSIGKAAFEYCESLSSMIIPNSVVSISRFAFGGCHSITSATIPSGVTSIEGYVFYACYSLTSIDIPSGVTTIGEYAFQFCSGLTSIVIPSGVTSIGERAFDGCYMAVSNFINNSSLDEVENNYWGATIVDSDTDGLLIKDNSIVKYRGNATSVTIPNSVTSIGNYAFDGCSSLTSCTIGSGVTSIGKFAFNDCSGLTTCIIGSGVTSIGSYAFMECTSLTSVTIGNSVTSIGSSAFESCSGLTSVTINATTPPTLGKYAFLDTNNCPIYVPSGSVAAYKAASGWSTYASRIQAIP